MEFKSRIDWLYFTIIIGTIVLCGVILFASWFNGSEGVTSGVIMTLVMFGLCWFLLSMLLGTKYRIGKTNIYYKCGPVRGKIEIDKIREVQVGKTLWSGTRAATAMNGLIIKFGKNDEVYISPFTNESFVKELKKIKHDIVLS